MAVCFINSINAQSFLNGSFENNISVGDQVNTSNSAFNILVNNCYSFGSTPNLDLISTSGYGCSSGPQHGDWYIGITGGGDLLSLELDSNLIFGNEYTISFYSRYCPGNFGGSYPVQIGLSDIYNNIGASIYTSNTPLNEWTINTFTFIAPNNGKFITVKLTGGWINSSWVNIDNFFFGDAIGVTENQLLKEISIYPIPTANKLFIDLKKISKRISIEIINITGGILRKDNYYDKKLVELNLERLDQGIYFLKIQANNQEFVKKIIVAK